MDLQHSMVEIDDLENVYFPPSIDRSSYCIHVHHTPLDPKKETLLMLHGYLGSMQDYLPFIDAFREEFNLILIDLRGHGKSEAPIQHSWTIEELSCDVKEVICSLRFDQTQFTLIASSISSAVSLELTNQFPELINQLVLISPTCEFYVPAWIKVLLSIERIIPRVISQQIIHYGGKILPLVNDKIVEEEYEEGLERFEKLGISIHRRIFADALLQWDADLSNISHPTLIIISQDDEIIFPSQSLRLHMSLSNSKIVITKNIKHQILNLNPKFVIQQTRQWLKR